MMKIFLSIALLLAITTNAGIASPTGKALLNSESKNSLSKTKAAPSPITFIQNTPVENNNQFQKTTNSVAKLKEKSKLKKKSFNDNHEMLSSLGLSKLRTPSNNHRKRLAVESRHHGRPDDSHMFIIKLPPNPYYYTQVNTHNSIDDRSKKIPVGFKSNGKPGKIYHWNVPILKKIVNGNNGRSNSKKYKEKKSNLRHDDDDALIEDLIDIKNTPTWTKSASPLWPENETIKYSKYSDGMDDDERQKILKKKSSPSYYAPVKPKKQNFQKYFPGNGKPKSFYIIENKNKNKAQKKTYHNLID